MNSKQVMDYCKEQGVRMVDLKFMDFPGLWQHFSVPLSQFNEDSFEDGLVLTVPASGAGSRSTPATCSSCLILRVPN